MMSLFSDEIHTLITSINTSPDGLKFLGVDILLAKNSPESQAALLSLLDSLQHNPELYWRVVNGLDRQKVIDAAPYYERVLIERAPMTHSLRLAALSFIRLSDNPRKIDILIEALLCHTDEQIIRIIVSNLIIEDDIGTLYNILLLLRQNQNTTIRRAIVTQIVPNYDAYWIIPIAIGLIYNETSNTNMHATAILLLWQSTMQGRIMGYEAQVVFALQYCMYSLPDLGVMPYRCLMEINTPEAKAALAQWDVDNKSAEVQFFR
jgi:hypothetical protein